MQTARCSQCTQIGLGIALIFALECVWKIDVLDACFIGAQAFNYCASHVIKGIREYTASGNEPFKVLVKVTNGKVLKELFVFQHAKLSALQHSIFTREVQDERLELYDFRGSTRINTGLIKQPAARESSAKLLQVAFATFEHHIIGKTQ
jgi:hypothetical protein